MKIVQRWAAALAACLLFIAGVSIAITDGELDGDAHPHVGLLIFDDDEGEPARRCSGTLLSPTVVLTAGHCTYGASGGRVWFDSTEAEILAGGYPDAGGTGIEFTSILTHPSYIDELFFLHDVGVVMLSEPVVVDEYGVLPKQDVLDPLARRRGRQDQTFTAVGYGLQRINPVFVDSERTRMFATPRLVQINAPGFTGDFSLLLSNNHATGGTCFGDSGGPNFIDDTNVIGGVTSFGLNGTCGGTGGVFRMDRADALDWLASLGISN